jgi:hypothetical protein
MGTEQSQGKEKPQAKKLLGLSAELTPSCLGSGVAGLGCRAAISIYPGTGKRKGARLTFKRAPLLSGYGHQVSPTWWRACKEQVCDTQAGPYDQVIKGHPNIKTLFILATTSETGHRFERLRVPVLTSLHLSRLALLP